MSDVQIEEYKTASGHCAYAEKGNYVWGTVIDSDGKKRVVCKCTKQNCRNFKRCRKDFNPAELKIVEENKNYHSTVSKKFFESEPVKSAEKIEKPAEEIQPVAKIEKPVEITQEKIIESTPDEKIIVNGGPGMGKTWTLIQKIIYMVETQNISADNILVFCFSRAAVDVVKSRNECQNIDIRNDNSDYDAPISLGNQFAPSSMAVTFILKENVLDFKISGSYAFYKPEKVSDKKILWQRDPYFFTEIFSFDKNIFNLEGGLQLQIYNQSYAGSNGKIVTVALVNTNFGGEKFSC